MLSKIIGIEMKKQLEIQDILRAGSVMRWNIVRTANQQTLAEHIFNVTMIARAIAKEMDIDDAEIIKAALEHDLDEVLYGDIPTPTKKIMKEAGANFDIIDNRPDRGPVAAAVVKVADFIEAMWFLKENKIGRHAEAALDNVYLSYSNYIHELDGIGEAWVDNLIESALNIIEKVTKGEFQIQ